MRGFAVNITTQDDLDGIRFRLFDNDELVVDNIGTLDFEYLTPAPYIGEHVLSITYFKENIPSNESEPQVFFTENFTLPTLSLAISIETF
jgi:hypothetical protein